jgi:site-specific DNA recombinase
MVAFLRAHPSCKIILVEKTDRLHRNMKDYVLLKELDTAEIHLVKEGQIIWRNSQSNAKFIYGIKTVMAENYIENLREEVNKRSGAKTKLVSTPSVRHSAT